MRKSKSLPRKPQRHKQTTHRPLTHSLARLSTAAAVTGALTLGGAVVLRAVVDWDGGSVPANNLWTDAANWSPDGVPAPTDDLVFGVGNPVAIDLVTDQTANSIAFNLNGFTLGTAPTAQILTITSGNVTVAPAVTGTIAASLGGAAGLTKLGTGRLVIDSIASFAFSGPVTINEGELQVNQGSALGTSNVLLGGTSGANAATFTVGPSSGGSFVPNAITIQAGSTGVKTIRSINTSGTNTLTGGIVFQTSATIEAANAGGTLALAGALDMSGLAGTVTFTGAGNTQVDGLITGSATANILKTGSGATTLSNVGNTLSGNLDVRGGTMIAGGTGAFGMSTVRVGDLTPSGNTNTALLANGGVVVDRPILVEDASGNTGTVTLGAATAGPTTTSEAAFTGALTLQKGVTLTAPALGIANFSGAINGSAATGLTITGGGTVKLSGEAASAGSTYGAVAVKGGTLQYDAAGGTLAIANAMSVNGGNLRATNGTLDLGNTIIQTDAPSMVAGLREAFVGYNNVASAFEEFAAAATTGIRSGPAQAHTTGANVAASQIINQGWVENSTYVYSGFINTPASGQISFAEAFDDNVSVRIDGVQVLRNTVWNVPTTTGSQTLSPGLHRIELRFGNGGTGFGPTNANGNNWPGTPVLGFGYNENGISSIDRNDYIDPATVAGLFQTNANYSTLIVDPNSTLRAGGFENAGAIQLYSNASSVATFALNDAAAPRANNVETIALTTTVNGQIAPGTLSIGNNQTVNSGNLQLGPNAHLTIAGAANAVLNVAGVGGNPGLYGAGSQLTTASGTINFNGTGSLGAGLRLNVGSAAVNIADNATIGALVSSAPGTATGLVSAPGRELIVNAGLYSGAITAGDFVKTGTGTFVFDGKAMISGTTSVNGGTLRLSNTAGGAGASIFSGGVVADGTGSLAVAVDPVTGVSGLGSSSALLNGGTLRIGPDATGLAPGAPGILGRYYNSGQTTNNSFDTNYYNAPTATRVDAQINFPDLTQAAQRPGGVNAVNISLIWGGFLNIAQGGLYTFTNSSDDGSSLFIDGVPVVVNEGSHGAPGPAPTGQIYLEPGLHSLHNRIVQANGGASVVMSYNGPDSGGLTQVVPASAFFQGGTAVTFNNAVTLFDGITSAVDAAGADVTLAGPINLSSGSILNLGSSTFQQMTITGSINYVGTGSAATVQIPTTSAALATAGFLPTFAGNVGFDVADGFEATDLTIPFAVRGSVDLTKTGPGTLALTGANTFAGMLNINGGLVSVGNNGQLGNASNAIAINGGGLRNTAPLALSRTVTVGAAGATFDALADLAVLNPITGAGGVTKTGAGILALPDGSTFGGAGRVVRLNGGVTIIGADSALGNAANTLSLANGATLRTSASVTRTVAFTAGGGVLDVAGPGNVFTLDGAITGVGDLTKLGAGTLRSIAASGAPLGSGNINFANGTIELAPATVGSPVSLTNGGTLTYGGKNVLVLNRGGNDSVTFTVNNLARGGTGTLLLAPASGTAALGGTERLVVGAGVPLTNGIAAPSILVRDNDAVGSGDFVTYGANGFARAAYTAGFNGASATEVAEITGATSLGVNESAYAVKVSGTTLDIGAANTLTLGDGTAAGLILNGGTISGGTVAFGAAEPIVFTSAANGTIASAVTGTNGLTKLGSGTLVLSGSTAGLSGGFRVNEGSISAAVSSTANPFGANAISLGGGTLSLTPSATLTPGLLANYFDGVATATTTKNYDPGAYAAGKFGTRIDPMLNMIFVENTPPQGYAGGSPGIGVGTDENTAAANSNVTSFGAQYLGQINILSGGPQTFSLGSDDSTRLFINGQLVIENDGGQGGTYPSTATITLAAGLHDIRVDYQQGTGGGNIRLATPYGLTGTGLTALSQVSLGNAVNVTADSTLDLNGSSATRVGLGTLTLTGGSVLTVNGGAGRTVGFASTAVTGAGPVGIDTNSTVTLGNVALLNTTLTKQGSGRLVLDNTTVTPNDFSGTNIQVLGGKLVALGSSVLAGTATVGNQNPLGAATVTLNGGGLVLDTKVGAVTFDNSVNVLQNATIEVVPVTSTNNPQAAMSLGTATRQLGISAGATLTIDSYAGSQGMPGTPNTSIGNQPGALLVVNAPLNGSGALLKTSSVFGVANGPTINRNFGQLTLTGDSAGYSGPITIDRGVLQANATTATAKPLGTGLVTLALQPSSIGGVANGGNLSVNLQANAGLNDPARAVVATALYLKSNVTNAFGNAVNLAGIGTEARFDVNNAGAGANNTITMGALGLTATSAPNFNNFVVTGGSNYTLAFADASPIALANDTTFTTTGSTLVLPMNIAAAGRTLTKRGGGTLTLGGTNTLGAVNVVNGTLTLLSNAAIGSAPVSVNGGILSLAGTATNVPASLALTTGPTFGLRFDNTVTNHADRWSDTAPVAIRSSVLELLGNPSAGTSETVGTLIYSGNAQVRSQRGNAGIGSTLTLDGLVRENRGTLQLNTTTAATLGADAKILVTNGAPANVSVNGGSAFMTSPGILSGSDRQFVSYDATNGFTLTPFSGSTIDIANANDVVNIAADTTLGADATVYALKQGNGTTAKLLRGGGTSVTITSGGLILDYATTNQNSNVDYIFGSGVASPTEAVIYNHNVFTVLSGKLTANDLTAFGNARQVVVLSGNNSRTVAGGAGLEGVVTINNGVGLSFRQNTTGTPTTGTIHGSASFGVGGSGAAGSNTTRLVLAGGLLEGRYDANLNVGQTSFATAGTGTLLPVSVIANSEINVDRTGTLTAQTAHFGPLTLARDVTLATTGGNTYRTQFNGGMTLSGGTATLVTGSSDMFQVGNFTETAPTALVKAGGNRFETSSNTVSFSGPTSVQGGVLQWNYNLNGAAGVTTQDLAWGGTFAAPATISLEGPLGQASSFRWRVDGSASGTANSVNRLSNPFVVAKGSVAQIYGYQNTNNLAIAPRIEFSGPIALGGALYIGEDAASRGLNTIYSGTITLDQSAGGERVLGYTTSTGGRAADLTGAIVDGAGGAGNGLTLLARTGFLNINAPANTMTYAGGTTILQSDAANYINVGVGSRLGTGNVTVLGGQLRLNELTNVAEGSRILVKRHANAMGLLTLGVDADPTVIPATGGGTYSIIDPASEGVLALDAPDNTWDTALDQSRLGKLFLGAHLTAAKTYTPATLGAGADGAYRLGGGYQSLTITNASGNLLNGTNRLLVGQAFNNGGANAAVTLTLNGSNNFTGGTTVEYGTSTFLVNGVNGLGTGPLAVNGGIVTLAQSQAIGPVTILGGTVNSNALNALGAVANPISIGAGTGLAVGPTLNFNTVEQTVESVTMTGNASLRPNAFTRIGTLNYGPGVLTVASTGGVLAVGNITNNSVDTSLQLAAGAGGLAISSTSQLPGGNVNLNGGVLVLDGVSFADFLANRSGGLAASGAATWQLNGGGFAARGTAVTIAGGGLTNSSFDRNFTLGSAATSGGVLYANAGVTLGQNTTFTAKRQITIAPTGPGLTRLNDAANASVYTITGNLDGAGAPIFRSTITAATDASVGEVVLAGANSWTGSATFDIDGGTNVNWFSSGPGGMLITTDGNPSSNGDTFVRFASPASLPTGSGGAASFLFANRYAQASARAGFLLTGDADGETYTLASGQKFLLGTINSLPAVFQGATLGGSGGNATLSGTAVSIVSGTTAAGTTAAAAGAATLLAREGSFTLGSAGAPVSFQPSHMSGVNNAQGTADPGLAGAATTLTDSTGARTLFVRGSGATVLGGVSYDLVNGTGDTSALFTWQVGAGTAGVAEGTVRELSSNVFSGDSIADNLSNVKVNLRGGVLEFGGEARAITLGAGVGQVNMAGSTSGGGFAAFGADRTLSLNGGAAMNWAGTGATAGFLDAGAPLILGSTTATHKVTLTNAININGGTRTIATVDGSAAAEGEIAGGISGVAGSILNFGGLNSPAGTALTRGKVILSGDSSAYAGSTNVNAGVLAVNTILGGTLAVNSTGTLMGTGTLLDTATVNTGGTLAPGEGVGVLNAGNVIFAGGSLTLEINSPNAGTGYDQLHTTNSFALNSDTPLTLSLGYDPVDNVDAFTVVLNDGVAGGSGLFTYNSTTLAEGAHFTVTSGAITQIFAISYASGTGANDVTLTAVPEPTTGAALLAGLGAFAGLRRLRRRP